MRESYQKIINIKRPASDRHPKMPNSERAAQFAPFAALTGLDASVREKARLTERRIELDDYEIEKLDEKLRLIVKNEENTEVSITYFVKDKMKNGGKYVTKEGRVRQLNEYEHKLIFSDGTEIPIEEIINIEGYGI